MQDLLGHDHFAGTVAARLRGEGDADGAADALLQEHRQGGSGRHNALAAHSGFRESQVQWVIAACGEAGVNTDQIL